MASKLGWLIVLSLLCAGLVTPSAAQQWQLSGDIRIHDPSVIEVDGHYVAFATGQEGGIAGGAIQLKTSPDGRVWSDAGTLGKGLPQWVEKALGFKPRNIWAPSISKHADTLFLYYSVSRFGVNTSAIGLMTSTSLDPEHPGDGWQDKGLVVASSTSDNFNAIDPWRIDTADGRAFLAFGSFWDGIKMRELDPVTGLLKDGDDTLYPLASRHGAAIEAPSIIEHDGYFFLFVSFDRCCAGTASTYNIRVGRADAVTGPYADADGVPMLDGGGTLILASTGRFVGPGGQEVFVANGEEMLAFHYYDRTGGAVAKLQIAPIHWSKDGWPVLDPLPE